MYYVILCNNILCCIIIQYTWTLQVKMSLHELKVKCNKKYQENIINKILKK